MQQQPSLAASRSISREIWELLELYSIPEAEVGKRVTLVYNLGRRMWQ
jgi:hypothetical protein